LNNLSGFDLIIKSPGIHYNLLTPHIDPLKITTQTDLFLELFGHQTIGITGTKGKSTTSSLIYHIFNEAGLDTILLGNIGIPPFDKIHQINKNTTVVFEMSCHQLHDVRHSPHIAVLLNIFEEHLDFYKDYENYQQAKINICKYQKRGDWFIYNADDDRIKMQLDKLDNKGTHFPISDARGFANHITYNSDHKAAICLHNQTSEFDLSQRKNLDGIHNLKNIAAAVGTAKIKSITNELVLQSVYSFQDLEHRLEFVGVFRGIKFYNDSIATIPEATIAAVTTLGDIDTLILGGNDRGINYSGLVEFLKIRSIKNIVFIGDAGHRISNEFGDSLSHKVKKHHLNNFAELKIVLLNHTSPGGTCLLSPAASSYDEFSGFEQRGNLFKEIARNL